MWLTPTIAISPARTKWGIGNSEFEHGSDQWTTLNLCETIEAHPLGEMRLWIPEMEVQTGKEDSAARPYSCKVGELPFSLPKAYGEYSLGVQS
jgi:hypothetical protein